MKFLGFLLIILGSALLIMQKWFATGNPVLTWMAQHINASNNNIIGISVAGAGVLLMLIGFLAGGRRDEI